MLRIVTDNNEWVAIGPIFGVETVVKRDADVFEVIRWVRAQQG